MSKKVLVITTSLRAHSNSEVLAEAFARGASEAGHETVLLSLKNKNLTYCRGCLVCQETGSCPIKDDAAAIAEQIGQAEVIAFATPVYYYEMSGQMKTLLDRTNTLYIKENRFEDVYLLSSAAEDGEMARLSGIAGLKGWIACFDKARFAGSVFAGGVKEGGDITGHPAVEEAYRLGLNL
ncbi:MAG: flavodoxin family protein [Lachnospiraceae bacterium]|nr:flavodoxin family protein [Lachnospiraceae bacterium]